MDFVFAYSFTNYPLLKHFNIAVSRDDVELSFVCLHDNKQRNWVSRCNKFTGLA